MEPEKPKLSKGDFLRRRYTTLRSSGELLQANLECFAAMPASSDVFQFAARIENCRIEIEAIRNEMKIMIEELEAAS